MKTAFIETRYKGKTDPSKIRIGLLPSKVALLTTVQFIDDLPKIKAFLEKNGKIVYIGKGKQEHPGQVLGCETSAIDIKKKVDAYLYIGDGRFHPIGISLIAKKEVFTFDPTSNEFGKIEKNGLSEIEKKRNAQLLKFYSSNEIGVIVSTKPGQNHLDKSIKLKKKFPKKNFYFVLFDNIDYSQLENFNFIQSWVNSACPRIEEDIRILNIDLLLKR